MAIELSRRTINAGQLPSNINPLSPLGFRFGVNKLPNVDFFAQSVNLPGVSIGQVEQATPLIVSPIPGEMLTYQELTIQFMVDENMTNYKSIVNWLEGLGFPEDHKQYTDYLAEDKVSYTELAKNYSDATLQILGSNNVAVQTLKFKDMFPTSIEGLQFNSSDSDVTYLVGNASFRYTNYVFED